MQVAGLLKNSFLIIAFFLFFGQTLDAQTSPDSSGFRWILLEVSDPTAGAKVQFRLTIPSDATNISWNFGDGNTSTELEPIHTYTSIDTFNVALNFTLLSDSTITRKVVTNSAFFIVKQDPSLINLATHKRIFQNPYLYSSSSNMRFEWTLDGVVIDNPENYPSIYYTFEIGGVYNVALKTWNNNDPTKSISFSRTVNISPVFGATKEVFQNIPNVFTPNGDNVHDFFEVPTSGTSRLKFMVYSRGGGLIYQQESNVIKWNGTNLNGKDLPEGIYYYILEDLDGRYENAKGFFYIFRGK